MEWIAYVLVGVLISAIATYFFLPRILQATGLHRRYTIPDFDLAGRRALIVCKGHAKLDPTEPEQRLRNRAPHS